MHMSLSFNDCSLWKYFIHEFLPKHSLFTIDELVETCAKEFVVSGHQSYGSLKVFQAQRCGWCHKL
jgi:hypothetical protein